MLNVAKYISYFKNLATQHKEIGHTEEEKHFFRMNIEEVLTGLRSDINLPALILESFEGRLVDKKSDNNLANREGAFMILKKVEVDNFDQENEFLDDSERIGLDIIKRMRRDSKTNPIQDRILKRFDYDGVSWGKVGPVFDNYYGYRFIFRLQDFENMKFDPDKWLDGNG